MQTECKHNVIEFQPHFERGVIGRFDGGTITSDGGALLLRETERETGIIQNFSECFFDYRDPNLIKHSIISLLSQRVFGIALGYEDLNDHDLLRNDPLLAVICGKADPTGRDHVHEQDIGNPLAGKSTLNRLELTPEKPDEHERYKKIAMDPEKVDNFFIRVFLESYAKAPDAIILDLDTTDDPLYGRQENRFFHGYYKEYCYLPLYVFCEDHLLCARLKSAENERANPRFVVTSLSKEDWDARGVYEDLYCGRGNMENRIKEQQLYLFADRTSTSQMRSNQIRLYFSSVAYLIMNALRRLGLKGTEMAQAQCHTIRLKLLKIGALVRISTRKIWITFSESYPFQKLFIRVCRNLNPLI